MYWICQDFTIALERGIVKQKLERNIAQSAVLKDRSYRVD